MIMKKNRFLCAILLLAASLGATAQDNIHFVAGTPAQNGMSAKNLSALKLKVEQIIARNNAGAASATNPFIIQPELVVGETKKTEGLLRDVTLVMGELSLTARNKFDGSVYGTAVIEVQGDATGSADEAISSLISGIKVTDPAFVRFIRTSRKRIAEFYDQNCATILKKGQALVAAGSIQEAADYLAAVPATAPCYDEVIAQLEVIGTQLPQQVPTDPVMAPEPDMADEPVLPELNSDPIADEPMTAPEPIVDDSEPIIDEPQAPALPRCKISVSCNDLLFELVSCQGNETGGTIRIHARFINTEATNNGATIRMTSAIDPDGATYSHFSQVEAKGCTPWVYGNKMPKGIKVGKVFEIRGVNSPCDFLSYVEISVDRCKVIIHNLPVEWN